MRTPDPVTSPQPFARIWPQVLLVAVLFFMNYVARCALSPVLAPMEASLGVGHAQVTSLLMVQGVGFAVSQSLAGFCCGLLPPRRVAALSLLASGMCLVGVYATGSLGTASLLFFGVGLSCRLYFPAGMALLGDLVRADDWGKAMGLHEMAPNMGFILLPLLAEATAWLCGWKSLFLLLGGTSMLLAGLFLLLGQGGHSPTARPSFAGCTRLLGTPAAWAAMLVMCVALCGEFSVFSILQLFLVGERAYSPENANLVLSLSRLATPLGVILGGWLADRHSAHAVLRACLVIHAASLAAMSCCTGPLLYAACAAQAVSIATLFPALFKQLALLYPLRLQPIALSLILPPAGFSANALMPWLLGVCGQYWSFGAGFVALAGASLAGALCLRALRSQ